MFALIFDMDGVIIDSEGLNITATVKYFQERHGVEMVSDDFIPYIGRGTQLFVCEPAKKYGLDIDFDIALAEREQVFIELFEAADSIVFPGVHDLISAAHKDTQCKLAIATASQESKARASLGIADVDIECFDVFLAGNHVKNRKPSPEIYNIAAQKLDLSPAKCIVIEDSTVGVTAAKAASMTCIAITNTFNADQLAEADHVIDSLQEITPDSLRALLPN